MKMIGLTLILLLASCGRDYNDNAANEGAVVGSELSLASKASGTEVSNARDICNAFRSKRLKIISGGSVSSINFNLTSKSCDDSSYTNTTEVQVDTRVAFVNKGLWNLYNGQIETDLSGHISQVCNQIYKGEDISILSYSADGSAVQYKFNSDLSFIIFTGKKEKQNSESYKITEKKFFQIDADSSVLSYGFVKRFKKENLCSSGSDSSYVEQSY